MKKIKIIAVFLCLLFTILPLKATGDVYVKSETVKPAPNAASDSLDKFLETFSAFNDAISIIKKYHLDADKITAERMTNALHQALKTYLKEVTPNDKFSYFFTPKEAEEMMGAGSYKGIGVSIDYIEVKNNIAVIKYIFPHSPAEKAGLKVGDEILSVNGKSVNKNFVELVGEVIKTEGKEIVLSVRRNDKTISVTVTIAQIDAPIMRKEIFGEIGYLAIYTFLADEKRFGTEFYEALLWLKDQGAKSLILDLRYNTGGDVRNALRVSDAFSLKINEPRLITQMKLRFKEDNYYTCPGIFQGLFTGPIVVLINHQSASASEIVAGALQDWNRAKIIGQKTFGKGVGQQIISFRDGSLLILTSFYYYLPSGRSIHEIGITPDIIIEDADPNNFGNPENDSMLKKAIQILSE